MGHLSTIFPDQFSGNKDEWRKVLQNELKIPDIDQKLSKNTLEGLFAILTDKAQGQVIPNSTSWKKSSQTYFAVDSQTDASVKNDLENGVRVFFLNEKSASLEKLILSHPDSKDIEIVHFGKTTHALEALSLVHQGGTHLQEVTALTLSLIYWAQKNPHTNHVQMMVSVDNHFFQSIAKIRAIREIAQKIFDELKMNPKLTLISIVNTREWTLYERYNNMLRNTASVAAGLVGGADLIQTLGYMTPFEMEAPSHLDSEHLVRSRRMSRNTTHILSLESMLGMVQDAAAGSYHLESLTDYYASEGWKEMQKLVSLSQGEQKSYWDETLKKTQDERLKQFNHRKIILSGINDFPNKNEVLGISSPLGQESFRLARFFEELRLRVEKLKPSQKKDVRIVFWGDYAALNARVNFVKNYFELLGLKVHDPHHSIVKDEELKSWVSQGKPDELIVLCAKDEDYPSLILKTTLSSTGNYVAGKVELGSLESIYGGQNVYDVLSRLVLKLESLV
ncbi:MAG: methylmalonyl-CoA mutase family protein [Bacteriovoracaceae bacterium]